MSYVPGVHPSEWGEPIMSRVALASSAPGRPRSKHEANKTSLEETQKTARFYNEVAKFQGLLCKKSHQTHPPNKIREFTCLLHQEHRRSCIDMLLLVHRTRKMDGFCKTLDWICTRCLEQTSKTYSPQMVV